MVSPPSLPPSPASPGGDELSVGFASGVPELVSGAASASAPEQSPTHSTSWKSPSPPIAAQLATTKASTPAIAIATLPA